MFEVKKDDFVNKTFRLPVALVNKLEQLAQQEHISLNKLVAQCCEYALDNHKVKSDKKKS